MKSLYAEVYEWLGLKLAQAQKMEDKARYVHATQNDEYTQGQLDYACNLGSSIRWCRAQIPRRWHDRIVCSEIDTILSEVSKEIVNGVTR